MASTKHRATTSGTVRFVLDGEVVTVSDVEPTRTVLNFLREDLSRTGTKEGCAEGDCGACTVVVGELKNGSVRFRAINSCIQFVPTLDGKELITVESLRGDDGALHPVQQALVDCHGSQCDFCTPGFVMSLFALVDILHDVRAQGSTRNHFCSRSCTALATTCVARRNSSSSRFSSGRFALDSPIVRGPAPYMTIGTPCSP